MMKATKITAVHIRLTPLRSTLVIERRPSPSERVLHSLEFRRMIHLLREVIQVLSSDFPDFLMRLEEVDHRHRRANTHRSRSYISRDRDGLYPKHSKHLASKHLYRHEGFWIATNLGKREITAFIEEACEAADVALGVAADVRL
jgi:hypothetical protein